MGSGCHLGNSIRGIEREWQVYPILLHAPPPPGCPKVRDSRPHSIEQKVALAWAERGWVMRPVWPAACPSIPAAAHQSGETPALYRVRVWGLLRSVGAELWWQVLGCRRGVLLSGQDNGSSTEDSVGLAVTADTGPAGSAGSRTENESPGRQ